MSLFLRRFGTKSFLQASKKAVVEALKTDGLKTLNDAPTIYNKVRSASNSKGYMKTKLIPGLYFTPSPTSATGSINSETIPKSFLPLTDPRRELVNKLREGDAKVSKVAPLLHFKGEKTYHLTPENVQDIIKLRRKDPNKYTRKTLAKMYKVSPLFISLVSSASPERKAEMDRRLAAIKKTWHPGRIKAREDRKKRKEGWYKA